MLWSIAALSSDTYHKNSVQNEQKDGCLKNLAMNWCPLTSWTFCCFMAPLRTMPGFPSVTGDRITEPPETEPLQLSHLKQNLYNWAIRNRTSTTEPSETEPLQLSHLKQNLYNWAIWNRTSTTEPSETEPLQLSHLKQNLYNWAIWNSNSTTEPSETATLQPSHLKQKLYKFSIWNRNFTTESSETELLQRSHLKQQLYNWTIWNWNSTTEPPEAAILCLAVCISDVINYQAGMCCKSMNMSAANCSSLFAGEEQTNVAAHEGTQIWSKNNNKVLL